MPKKRRAAAAVKSAMHGVIEGAGQVQEQPIVDTLEKNYMPYAISVIMSRAIPEIDGFKPSHRKLLYTMYKKGLLTGSLTKSANIVGETMKLNPHGDAAIYDTMVRLSRGYEALLHPYVESKGNFGKFYSRDMAWAASRYTEAKLAPICAELFSDIDKDTVDFVPNYDNTMEEPTLLPARFPSVLVNANTGIAVGMASNVCSFNLKEVCETTIARIQNPNHDILSTLQAPDFTGGGQILYDREQMKEVYRTGRGSIRVRSRYSYDKTANCIDITQIPPTTTVEAIVEKVIDLVKQGKAKEISDIRDETGLAGLKITIDLKRGTDPTKLMTKLFHMTPLEDSFSCNFNILVDGAPKVMGVGEILDAWTKFRINCVRRRTEYDLQKKMDKLHLLMGLQAILLDIDKAIKIVRETEEESEVVPNLMIGFGIDETQAEYVAEIKLRHLNREFILKRTDEIGELQKQIAELNAILDSDHRIKAVIIKELKNVADLYGQPRRSILLYADQIEEESEEEEIPDYPVNLFFTKDGYFKKITPQSLRMSNDQKLKEGDAVLEHIESTNNSDLLFFTDRCQVYKARTNDFSDTKASVLGDYIPAKLQMDEGENAIFMVATKDYQGTLVFFFGNGKAAKVELSSYETKTNRKKLVNAYSDKSPLVKMFCLPEDIEILLTSTQGRMLLVHTGAVPVKTTRSTQGVQVITLRRSAKLQKAEVFVESSGVLKNPQRYRKTIPAIGSLSSKEELSGEQLTF
ncbi:DNA gyrase/topoisomerase IV subunit A [Caproicibacterium sp. BJN0003]|uniref:DNA gyrase/topoisomerase IV subunit A n=1 Tax=Caproicibacterium sp. BJN0003 TaxID=2994078 RepID=UPI002259D748|nr:DNA topoisomerase (ATP-hydrolyzing) subunit A [Caproicibacterium sp. BJN0003]UZT81875.1 DNA topoisomerase (ATP-hydrolyzing) subunit A [Caproicibacterium sp. BJN0003]